MPCKLLVICAGEFLRADAHGKPDLQASRRVLADLAAAMIAGGFSRALLDVRNAGTPPLSTSDLFALATTFHEAGFRQEHRLAVLHRPDRIARADFFAMCAVQRGWNVCAFDTFEDAFEWLSFAVELSTPPPSHPGDSQTQPGNPPQ